MPSTREELEQLLKDGIAAAREGQSEQAFDLLSRFTQLVPDDVRGWLWLSGVAPSIDDQLTCLETVLSLDPENSAARKGIRVLHQQQVEVWVQQGTAAVERGDRVTALEALTQAVTHDEQHLMAWWMLSQVVESVEDQEICLENVLTLAPDHAAAREALSRLRQSMAEEDDSAYEFDVAPLPPDTAAWDTLDDPYLCPYCAAPTEVEDKTCPNCGKALWITQRALNKIRVPYWIIIALELSFVAGGALLSLLLLAYAGLQMDLPDFLVLFPLYLGTVEGPELTSVAFSLVPRALFWLSLAPSVVAILILLVVVSRWRPLFLVAIILEAIRLVTALGGLLVIGTQGMGYVTPSDAMSIQATFYGVGIGVLYRGIIAGYALIGIFTIASFVLLRGIVDHFEVEDRRILLRVDSDVKGNEMALWLRGRNYIRLKLWALAALHLQHALALQERLETYLQLVVAYVRLERYDMAERTLADARSFSPTSAELDDVAELLERARRQSAA